MPDPATRGRSDSHHYDVVILGGGLAGGCLARQLHQEAPHLRTLVVEKRPHPVPEAAFKVGESSVEIGAHYFSKRLGLEDHLRTRQLEKLGLRYFFTHGDNRDIGSRVELGPPQFPPVPSFQLDRGRLENMLLESNAQLGIDVLHGCKVESFQLASEGSADPHQVTIVTAGASAFAASRLLRDEKAPAHEAGGSQRTRATAPECRRTITARWVVDASGRAGLIKRKLGLARPSSHGANASWWRVKTRVEIDDWSSETAWKARVPSGLRWQSTVHLMGPGYWVWLIPLGSGSHSFGIVADGDMHPYDRINRFERAMDWLREFEPQCAEVMERHADQLEDFLALKHFAHSCERVFSPDRWALVGEAGVFTDPFYSPGSDFIAMGNDYVTDLILRETAGESIAERVESFNTTYLRLFDAFIRLYDGQYPIMGNAQVMTAKVSWDNATYWAITALLFFQQRYRRPEFMASIDPMLRRFFVLHARMQALFRAWSAADDNGASGHAAVNIVDVDFLRRLQADLALPLMDDEPLRARLDANLALLEAFARTWQRVAAEDHPSLARFVSDPESMVPSLDVRPLRVSMMRLPA
jgi:flavin-dependent dehydrogenase